MNQEELKAALTKIEGGDALYEAVSNLVTAERTRGIEESSKANREAKNLRKFKKALEAAGIAGDDEDEEALSAKIKDISMRAKTAEEAGKGKQKATEELSEWQKKAMQTEEQLGKLMKDLEEKDRKIKTSTIRQTLDQLLGEKVYGKQNTITAWIAEGRVQFEDEKVIFIEGDKKLPVEDGVKFAMENGLVDLKVTQNPGAGPGGQGTGGKESEAEKLNKINKWRNS